MGQASGRAGAAAPRARLVLPRRAAAGEVELLGDDVHAAAVRRWVDEFIIGLNFCPFARPADERQQVRIVTSNATTEEGVLADLAAEADRLSEADEAPVGQAITTLVVCPNVATWQDFGAFQAFYDGALAGGYALADRSLYVVPFHPRYGSGGPPAMKKGDVIELGEDDSGAPMTATVLDPEAGFGEQGQRLAQIRVDADSEECFIELPPVPDKGECLVSRAPRPTLHLLRTLDLEKADDRDLRARNRKKVAEMGPAGVEELMQRCG